MKEIYKKRLACLIAVIVAVAAVFPAVPSEAADKTSVYVVTKMTVSSYGTTENHNYDYNSNGLLSQKTGSDYTNTFTYDGKKLVKAVKSGTNSGTQSFVYTYNSSNRLSKLSCTNNVDSFTYKYSEKYSYDKKGRIYKSTYKESGDEALSGSHKYTYSYNSKGHLSKRTVKSSLGATVETFVYDGRENLKKMVTKFEDSNETLSATYKNTYKSGRLVKKVVQGSQNYKATIKYTYKKISVPKSYASAVKKQQRDIINDETSIFKY